VIISHGEPVHTREAFKRALELPAVALCVRQRARHAVYDSGISPDDRAVTPQGSRPRTEGSSAHASPRLRYALANKGHDTRAIQGWLGHRPITSTAVLHGAGA
jgi:hypothetical protein